MRVGFVLECHRDGADHKVIEHLVRALRKDVDPRFACCGSKRVLFDECGKFVEGLFEAERCERVFVVWDLVPCDGAYLDEKGRPCRSRERAYLRQALRNKDRARTVMLCITHELEAWLLCDSGALEAVLARPTHPIERIGDMKRPEELPNPKKHLGGLFKKHRGRDYEDRVHALQIMQQVKNLSKLEKAPSFARLREKLEGL
ncbi:MAG TPA: DUF4276 family protein [Candidatus Nanopelagicales bacterium]|nr:DUF4276 family protein [Candidatus Nanopelagicales bacterium]